MTQLKSESTTSYLRSPKCTEINNKRSSFSVETELGDGTGGCKEHDWLIILFEFSCVISQLRADTARTYLQYCILKP